jgi:hypothetical protein
MATAVTVPVIVIINLILILCFEKLFYQVWNDTAVIVLVFISFPFASNHIRNCLVTVLILWLKYLHLCPLLEYLHHQQQTLSLPFVYLL